MNFQRPVRATKKGFRLLPCLEKIIVQGEVAFDAARFRILPIAINSFRREKRR